MLRTAPRPRTTRFASLAAALVLLLSLIGAFFAPASARVVTHGDGGQPRPVATRIAQGGPRTAALRSSSTESLRRVVRLDGAFTCEPALPAPVLAPAGAHRLAVDLSRPEAPLFVTHPAPNARGPPRAA